MAVEILGALDEWGKISLRGGPQEQSVELLGKSHGSLLAEAWKELDRELKENSSTPQFLESLKNHSQRIVGYWRSQVERYLKAGGLPLEGKAIEIDGEKISVWNSGEYSGYIEVKRQTATEEDEITLRINDFGEINDAWGPQIKSEIKEGSRVIPDITFEVTLAEGMIVKIERRELFEDPEGKMPFVEKTEIINCQGARYR